MLKNSVFLFLFFFCSVVNAQFSIDRSENNLTLSYANTNAIESLESGKINFSEFKKNLLVELNNTLKTELSCTDITLTNCPKTQKGELVIFLPNYYCISRSSKYCLEGLSKLDSLSQIVIHEFADRLSPYFYNINTNEYQIKALHFFDQEKESDLKKVLKRLNQFFVKPGAASNPSCIQRVNSPVVNGRLFSATGSFNLNKCLEAKGDPLVLAFDLSSYNGFLRPESDNENFRKAPYDFINAKYREILLKQISIEQSEKSVVDYILTDYNSGNEVDLIDYYSTRYIVNYLFHNHYKLSTIKESVDILKIESLGVSYNGVSGLHHFTNKKLAKAVVDLAINISRQPEAFTKYVLDNNLAELFLDTNDSSEVSRLEPIDLVANMLYRLKRESQIGDEVINIQVNHKNFMKKYVMSLLGLSESSEVLIYRRSKKSDAPFFECANLKGDDFAFMESNISNIYEFSTSFDSSTSLSFECSSIPYELKVSSRNADPLPEPREIKIDDDYVDILIPFALTDEISEKFKNMAKTYFKLLGFELKETRFEDASDLVKKELIEVDGVIPVGHVLASRDLDIGTKRGVLWTLTKEKEKNEKYGTRLKIMIPETGNETAQVDISELSLAYQNRISSDKDPLLVFVQTCSGEGNLPVWSLIYRNALEALGREGFDDRFPHVIASERGFPTSSDIEIASSILYPTELAELMAQGKNPTEIYNYFVGRKYGSLSVELTNRFIARGLPEFVVKKFIKAVFGDDDIEIGAFEPVYNLSNTLRETTLKQSGMQYKLIKNGTDVIMDETF